MDGSDEELVTDFQSLTFQSNTTVPAKESPIDDASKDRLLKLRDQMRIKVKERGATTIQGKIRNFSNLV